MNRQEVQNGIHRSWKIIDSFGLTETFSNPSPLLINEEFRDLILSDENTYVDVFMSGLRLSHYNFLLTDYSYFQFSWESTNNVRYAYYPNPFISDHGNGVSKIKRLHQLVENGELTYEEYLSILRSEDPKVSVPVIRYENAPDQYRELTHPCSHFHIGYHSKNRWAVSRILTPLTFSLLILKHYYGDFWNEFGKQNQAGSLNCLEEQLINEKRNCRIIGDELFSKNESMSFFFS